MKTSPDGRFLVVLGINVSYKSSLYFIELEKGKLLACLNLSYSLVFKIRDLEFTNRNDEFLTVGIHHFSKFKYKAGILEFKELNVDVKLLRKVADLEEI